MVKSRVAQLGYDEQASGLARLLVGFCGTFVLLAPEMDHATGQITIAYGPHLIAMVG